MKEIFQIDKSWVKELDDEQARELVARLCKAECRTLGLPESMITWGGNQRAKDGGVDVRAKLPGTPTGLDFIPNASSAFQVKAETFPPSKISGEVAPAGNARAIYDELKNENGAYIIVSTRDDCSDLALKERTDKINETLAAIGYGVSIATDFYCSRRLADWIEKYPAIVTWVRSILEKPIIGWRPYGAWAYREHDVEAEYLIDNRVRVFVPGSDQGKDIALALKMIRSDLQRPRSIRIVGLSGVGKTRLVQAVFDKRVLPEQSIPSAENVVYCDLANDLDPQPSGMIEALASKGSDAILVVDNCSPAEHARLTEKVLIPGRKLKLITIEYDIRDDVPESTSVYRLEGSSKNIIIELLQRHYKVLSRADADRIAEYSDGNARVAFALAGTAESAGDFARLRSSDLFARLFHQNKKEDEGLVRSAEVASLLYSFDGEANGSASEIEFLAVIADCTASTFQRHLTELGRRGLLQKRGTWRAVLPHAIANQLSAKALENLDIPTLINTLFVSAGERVARSFSRRLGYLHECPPAVKIARSLLSEEGQLGDIRTLGAFQDQMFVNLAPLCPESALACIERAQTDSRFLATENPHRKDCIRLASLIAYDSEFFERASTVLARFSVSYSSGDSRDNAREALVSLFQIILSGTQAAPGKRMEVAQIFLNSSERKTQDLGLEMLSAGLRTKHFSPQFDFEFGSRHRDNGWSPPSETDVVAWFSGWLNIACEIAEAKDERAPRARTIVAEAFRGLWSRVELQNRLIDLSRTFLNSATWPEGWLAVRRILQWDCDGQSKTSLSKLYKLKELLRPRDLLSEIRAYVLAKGAFSGDFMDANSDSMTASSQYQRARDYAEKLGEMAATEEGGLDDVIAELMMQNASDKTYSFGYGVGKTINNPTGLLQKIQNQMVLAENSQPSLIFVRGLIAGWNKVDPNGVGQFLDSALKDEVWSRWFVELQVQSSLDDRAFERLLKAINERKAPLWQFRYLAGGRATDPFSVQQIHELVRAINRQGGDGCFVAFDLFSMVIHCANEKDEAYRDELRRVGLEFLRNVEWHLVKNDRGRWDYDIGVVLRFVLSGTNSQNEVNEILQKIIDSERLPERYYSADRAEILAPFFEYFPIMTLNAIYQIDENGSYSFAYGLVMDTFSEQRESALAKIPGDVLVEWCNLSPTDRYPFAGATCQLFETPQGDSEELAISQTAINLLHHAPDKLAVVKEFVTRFRPTSWSGSLADILTERLPLLQAFNPTKDDEIAGVIKSVEVELHKWISAEHKREADDERRDSSSFE